MSPTPFAAVTTALFFLSGMLSPLSAQDSAISTRVVLGETPLLDGIPGFGLLTEEQIHAWLENPANHATLQVELPQGLDASRANISIPEDNPLTRAKIELGRQLFFDKRLSAEKTVSCATCHDPAMGYGAETRFGVGIGGQEGGRNSPVAFNRILSGPQFWDGRADSLETQAVGPIENPIEMGNTHDIAVSTLRKIPGYVDQFETIFGDGLTIENVGKAIASFERALVTGPAPYDFHVPVVQFETTFADDLEYLDEEPELKAKYDALKQAAAAHPMSESAQRGLTLFMKKAKCATCHVGANFTDEQYHNLGVGMETESPDLGRFEVTKIEKDRGAFKTPTLRNIEQTGPYMHDGSQETLAEVVEWYNKGGHKNAWLSDKMEPLNLTEQEKADLVNFMTEGLTGALPPVNQRRLPR